MRLHPRRIIAAVSFLLLSSDAEETAVISSTVASADVRVSSLMQVARLNQKHVIENVQQSDLAADEHAEQNRGCIEGGVAFVAHDIGQEKQAITLEQCQDSCGRSPQCTHFSFENAAGANAHPVCLHKTFSSEEDVEIFRFDMPGVSSGPKSCRFASSSSKQPEDRTNRMADHEDAKAAALGHFITKLAAIPTKELAAIAVKQNVSVKGVSNTTSDEEKLEEKRKKDELEKQKREEEKREEERKKDELEKQKREEEEKSRREEEEASEEAKKMTALKAEWDEMKKGALRKLAAGIGIDEDTLEEADDADDTKAALIDLLVACKEKELKEERAVKQEVNAKKEEEAQSHKNKEKEEATTSAEDDELFDKGGWLLGAPGRSCTATCAASGRTCREDLMLHHMADVESEKAMEALVTRLGGGPCKEQVALDGNDVPALQKEYGLCFFSTTDRPVSTLDCGAPPLGRDQHLKQRLCWCDAPCPPSMAPHGDSQVFFATGAAATPTKDTPSMMQLNRTFNSMQWRPGETWTMRVKATSSDKESRRFGFVGNGGMLSLEVPPGSNNRELELVDTIQSVSERSDDASTDGVTFKYLGDGEPGDIVFSDAFVAPGTCSLATLNAQSWSHSLENDICPDAGHKAHGRCWYLSEQGTSCGRTCSAKGLSFFNFVADESEAMIPQLTGHKDLRLLGSLGSVECYVEDGGHYHLAALEGIEGIEHPAAWQDENCQLACPCSPCPSGGLWKHGRCWYLSAEGASCDSTCADSGLAFSMFVASEEEPMVPQLLSRTSQATEEQLPNFKQFSWGTSECYVPGESRFHPADSNGMGSENPGGWNHFDCHLACSCEVPT